jgi:hypothetical protein
MSEDDRPPAPLPDDDAPPAPEAEVSAAPAAPAEPAVSTLPRESAGPEVSPPASSGGAPASRGGRDGRAGSDSRRASGESRPALAAELAPLFRETMGFRLRLEPADLVRLRELPGARGKSDRELGEEFFEKLADRFARALAEDVPPPAEVRVVVDPYSRQAFLAIDRTIRSILSF